MPAMDPHGEPPDVTHHLPCDLYWLALHTLRGLLPSPPTGAPEDEIRRDRAAIAQVASMLPATAEEAVLAARCVGFGAYAMDCLRLAREYRATDHAWFLKCTAMGVSAGRQANSARSLLLRLQTARRKRQADNAAADQDAWTEHCAVSFMADALGQPAHAATPPEPPPDPQPDAKPVPDLAAEADQYAIIYPERAERIRTLGGLPRPCDFGPPSPDLVSAIVTGTTPTLRALDRAREGAGTDNPLSHARSQERASTS